MSEAKDFKEGVAEKAREDSERDFGEDPKETTEGKPRKDSDQEIPAWADAIMKRLDAMDRRDRKDEERRPMEAADRKDRKDGDEKEREAGERAAGMEEEKRKLEDRKDRRDESEEKRERDEKEGGHKANEERWAKERDDRKDRKDRKDEGDTDEDTDREDRARRDAQMMSENRKMAAKIAEMESRIKAVYSEPSIEDRQAIAEVRSRADSLYQALTGQPASMPIPGESPISYRKRMADGLRRYSDRMKDVRVDSLTGEAFAVIEDRIYTDAQAAIKSDAIVPAGTLRPITRNDSGHFRTDYIGDSSAWTEPFQAGAIRRLKLVNPKAAH